MSKAAILVLGHSPLMGALISAKKKIITIIIGRCEGLLGS